MDNKQHSSHAIDNSSLENVSGGFMNSYGFPDLIADRASWEEARREQAILDKHGIEFCMINNKICFRDKNGNEVSDATIKKLLS